MDVFRHLGNSNSHSRHIILWRNMENYHFYNFDSNPRFPPFLRYVRCESGVTFVWSCFRDTVITFRPSGSRAILNYSTQPRDAMSNHLDGTFYQYHTHFRLLSIKNRKARNSGLSFSTSDSNHGSHITVPVNFYSKIGKNKDILGTFGSYRKLTVFHLGNISVQKRPQFST